MRPASGIGCAGELLYATTAIRPIELAQPTPTVVEEQTKSTGNDVCPAGGVGRARDLVDVALPVYIVKLAKAARALVEE